MSRDSGGVANAGHEDEATKWCGGGRRIGARAQIEYGDEGLAELRKGNGGRGCGGW